MEKCPQIKKLRSILNKYPNLVLDKLIEQIANDLDQNLREIDETNSDNYGNIYYQGSHLELCIKLKLVVSYEDQRITRYARQLYEEFKRNGFYRE